MNRVKGRSVCVRSAKLRERAGGKPLRGRATMDRMRASWLDLQDRYNRQERAAACVDDTRCFVVKTNGRVSS